MTSPQYTPRAEFLYEVSKGIAHLAIRGPSGEVYHPSKSFELTDTLEPIEDDHLLLLPYMGGLIKEAEVFAKENGIENLFGMSLQTLLRKHNITKAHFTTIQ